MGNIWDVLLQSGVATGVSVILLGVRKVQIFQLTPRFPLSLWSLLFVRLCIPVVCFNKVVGYPFYIQMEQWKTSVERGLDSQYTSPFFPLDGTHVLPFVPQLAPQSSTDWLYVLYGMGVIVVLSYYVLGYLGLQLLLLKSREVDDQRFQQVTRIAENYQITFYKVQELEGVASPFVCGIWKPTLILPQGKEIEDVVLLHELVHVQQKHPLKNTVWCIFTALHWWNPLLLYCISQAKRDIEISCDSMVLEKMKQPQQRKDYGTLLLSVADVTGISSLGTSCISRGGKTLQQRISYIAKFQPFEPDLSVLSWCVIGILAVPFLVGNTLGFGGSVMSESRLAFAEYRLQRSHTMESAIENYVDSMKHTDIYRLSMVSPLSQQENFLAVVESAEPFYHPTPFPNHFVEKRIPQPTSFSNTFEDSFQVQSDYLVFNLVDIWEDGTEFHCLLVFSQESEPSKISEFFCVPIAVYQDVDGKFVVEPLEDTSVHVNEMGDFFTGNLSIPYFYNKVQGKEGYFEIFSQHWFCIKAEETDYFHHNVTLSTSPYLWEGVTEDSVLWLQKSHTVRYTHTGETDTETMLEVVLREQQFYGGFQSEELQGVETEEQWEEDQQIWLYMKELESEMQGGEGFFQAISGGATLAMEHSPFDGEMELVLEYTERLYRSQRDSVVAVYVNGSLFDMCILRGDDSI